MNVLFQIRNDYMKNMAGDTIQLLKTAEYLSKLGINVDISTRYSIPLKKYDIVHLFNLIRVKETYIYAINAIEQNKPYVLSTIYWNMSEYIINDKNTPTTLDWWSNSNDLRKKVLNNASALLPNSNTEMLALKKDFNPCKKYFIIPNCCDSSFYNASPKKFIARFGLRDFVLCAGRISYRKNQLSLINALKGTNLMLVLIGRESSKEYSEMCKAAAGKNVLFLNEMKHHELASAYSAARVHVLPSWFETPGLSSLEAGLAGCNIVTTIKGSTKEYFHDMAYYCEPANQESIRKAVIDAFNKPKDDKLKTYILHNLTWETAALKTLEAYKYVLNNAV